MNLKTSVFAFLVVLTGCLAGRAEIKVAVGHNANGDTSAEFKFKNVPSPSNGISRSRK